MRILFLHQHYYPETVGTSTRAVEIVEYLVSQGHEVDVVTGLPCHPSTIANGETVRKQPRFEVIHGARVYRTWTYASAKRDTFLRRMMMYGSFMVLGALKALRMRGKYDALVAVSPLPNGVAGLIVSRLRGIPLMFDVCDIWPDCAVAVGMLRPSLTLRVAQWLEMKIYNGARRIGVVTRGFTENLAAKGVPRAKICLLPDWVDPETYSPDHADRKRAREAHDLDGKFVVSFLGNFGLIMGLELILDTAAILLKEEPKILFLFVGKGVALPMMNERIAREALTNVRVIPYQPRTEVPNLLAASDVLMVTYKQTEITQITVPSKIYEYLSMARPIVAGVDGVLAEILEESGSSFVLRERNPKDLADAILRLSAKPELGLSMGRRGRAYAMEHFSFSRVAADYETTIKAAHDEGLDQ
jgi:colanic acid biosynthesis glycosyl transferase WcaI